MIQFLFLDRQVFRCSEYIQSHLVTQHALLGYRLVWSAGASTATALQLENQSQINKTHIIIMSAQKTENTHSTKHKPSFTHSSTAQRLKSFTPSSINQLTHHLIDCSRSTFDQMKERCLQPKQANVSLNTLNKIILASKLLTEIPLALAS